MFRSFKNSGVCRCERTKIFKELGCKAKGLVNKGSRNGPSEAGVLASKFSCRTYRAKCAAEWIFTKKGCPAEGQPFLYAENVSFEGSYSAPPTSLMPRFLEMTSFTVQSSASCSISNGGCWINSFSMSVSVIFLVRSISCLAR